MEKTAKRRSWRRTTATIIGTVIIGGGLILLLAFYMVHFLVDLWWFDSVGYDFYFWQRLLYRYAVFTVVTAVFFFLFFLNFRIGTRHLRNKKASSDGTPPLKKKGRMLRTGSPYFFIPLSLILAIVVALPLFQNWEKFLFFLLGPDSGIQDTIFGRDVSYYLFSYPIYTLMQERLLIAFLVVLAGSAILYGLEYGTRASERKGFPKQSVWHLRILVGIVFLLGMWRYGLQWYGLVYTGHHEPLFFGPGYLEMKYELPLIWGQILLLAGTGIAVMIGFTRRKSFIAGGILAACFCLIMGLRNTDYVREEIYRYWVQPDRLEREKPFIDKDVRATLHGYRLQDVTVRNFRPELLTSSIDTPSVKDVLRNVPLWEEDELKAVYDQLQVLRTYYDFSRISVGRYTVGKKYQQVFLAVRELDYDRLPGSAKTWVNQHLNYTHGYGFVMNPASQEGDAPLQWFARGLPLESQYGIEMKRPEIYFGVGPFNEFVIAPNVSGEFDYAQEDAFVTSSYQGHGGVLLSSYFSRALFAYYLNDKNIFFSTQLRDDSRILFRRNVLERIRTLAPYLLLDRQIYPVVTPEHLYWVQDAYTTSAYYPNSQPTDFQGRRFNYIRNSVKIVVDAYDGSVDFYVFDHEDPIIRAYERIYPGLFKDQSEMPPGLKTHIRYPRDFFHIQMNIYAKYHQRNPVTFFEQEDAWEFANTLRGQDSMKVRPYYLTLGLINPPNLDFLIVQPMTPLHLDNLRALVVGGCDGDDYGKIIEYAFPKGELVYSPVQISALINAEPAIVEQFNLWDMSGSKMKRGKMVILPVQKTVLYIQPIFLQAETRHPIPELQRVVMTDGHFAVMDASLEGAYRRLRSRVNEMGRRSHEQSPGNLPFSAK